MKVLYVYALGVLHALLLLEGCWGTVTQSIFSSCQRLIQIAHLR